MKKFVILLCFVFCVQPIIAQTIRTIKVRRENLYPFKQNVGDQMKYGYINRQGRVVLAAFLDYASDFYEGRGLIILNGKYGFVNAKGKYAITPQFDYAERFSEGLAFVEKAEKAGFIDVYGVYRIQNIENQTRNALKYASQIGYEGVPERVFHNGVVALDSFNLVNLGRRERVLDSKSFYINQKGKLVEPFLGELLYKSQNDRYIDYPLNGGTVVFNPKMDTVFTSINRIEKFSDGLARFYSNSVYKAGFLDVNGETVIPAQFDYGDDFAEGLAAVGFRTNARSKYGSGKKYGFINKLGEIVIPAIYNRVDRFHNGLARVEMHKENKDSSQIITISYIDKKGNKVFTYTYDLPAPPALQQPDILEVPEDN